MVDVANLPIHCAEVILSKDLALLIGERFIQRSDVKAIQFANGAYIPDRKLKIPGDHAPLGWFGRHILSHIEGRASYGHYLLDADNNTKLFAFDVDLIDPDPEKGEALGSWFEMPDFSELPEDMSDEEFDKLVVEHECNPRELWTDGSAPGARKWYKYQMSMLARKLTSVIRSELNIPCAAAYSGHKGIHVYGFTGTMPASEARAGALLVLEASGEFEPLHGENFFKHKHGGPMGYPSFSIETFPKQNTVTNKDGLGNLMRLPMGRNLKSPHPAFFLDLTAPVADLKPHPDPIRLLTTGEPYL